KEIIEEEERFLKEQSIPPMPTIGLNSLIVKIQEDYNRALSSIQRDRDTQIINRLVQYIKHLEGLKAGYMRQEDTGRAISIEEELVRAKETYRRLKATLPLRAVRRKPGQETSFDLGGGIKLVMVWIPPGHFQMGSPDDEEGRMKEREGPVHRVTLSKGFWMGKYEVTQEQWKQVMRNNPSRYKGAGNPVETVSWDDCQEFLQRLNAKVKNRKFRLPTEAEWEYACRAGTTTRYYTGNMESDLVMAGWPKNYSHVRTHEVGQKKPNRWGLHDMHGNVQEWCADRYGTYQPGAVIDPLGPSKGKKRVVRGGGFRDIPRLCRSAVRAGFEPSLRSLNQGLRIAGTSE
ncbi:MAG: formylglycine-generating enzyme family protein, partial [Verrucomicrobiota bacterium]